MFAQAKYASTLSRPQQKKEQPSGPWEKDLSTQQEGWVDLALEYSIGRGGSVRIVEATMREAKCSLSWSEKRNQGREEKKREGNMWLPEVEGGGVQPGGRERTKLAVNPDVVNSPSSKKANFGITNWRAKKSEPRASKPEAGREAHVGAGQRSTRLQMAGSSKKRRRHKKSADFTLVSRDAGGLRGSVRTGVS